MEHELAQLDVLVPFVMQVCQQPSMGPVHVGSGSEGPPSDVELSEREPSRVPPSSVTGSPGQNEALFERKQVSALSAQTPSIHAAPRYERLPVSHAQHDARQSA